MVSLLFWRDVKVMNENKQAAIFRRSMHMYIKTSFSLFLSLCTTNEKVHVIMFSVVNILSVISRHS